MVTAQRLGRLHRDRGGRRDRPGRTVQSGRPGGPGAVQPAVRPGRYPGATGGGAARGVLSRLRRHRRPGRDRAARGARGGVAASGRLVRRGARRLARGRRARPAARRWALRRGGRPSRSRRPAALRHRATFGRLHAVMLYDCSLVAERDRGIAAAVEAVQRGDLVVLPTDTVYGLGADAFKSWAVSSLLNAKGRDRQMPPPVLVGSRNTLDGLVISLPAVARDLVEAYGTVAVRMPLHPVALEVLRETGPMAVSSANKTGQPPAVTAEEAREQLGYTVSVYLEA